MIDLSKQIKRLLPLKHAVLKVRSIVRVKPFEEIEHENFFNSFKMREFCGKDFVIISIDDRGRVSWVSLAAFSIFTEEGDKKFNLTYGKEADFTFNKKWLTLLDRQELRRCHYPLHINERDFPFRERKASLDELRRIILQR